MWNHRLLAVAYAAVAFAPWREHAVQPGVGARDDAPHAELLAPGTIDTPDYELNAAFTPDGRTLYFTRIQPNWPAGPDYWVIAVAHLAGGRWSEPEVAPFSGRYNDADPVVSPDGRRLFFVSNRPLTAGAPPKRDYDIWMMGRQADGAWGEPVNLGPNVNSDRNEYYPSVAANGTLYLQTTRPDSRGGDLYRSRLMNGVYQPIEPLGDSVNSQYGEGDAAIAPDESFIVFAGYGRPDSYGGADLYISYNRGGLWSAPRHLGPSVNTPAREFCPILSPDGKYLYFTSEIGFAADPRARPLSMREFRERLHSVRNGLGNIYRIDRAVLEGP